MTCAFRLPQRAIAFAVVLVIVLSVGASTVEADATFLPQAIPRYTFDVDLDYAYHRLHAFERIALPNPSSTTLSELVLNVPSAHSAGTFYLQDIQVGNEPAQFDFVGTLLTVTLPSPLLPAEVVTLRLDFTLYVKPLGQDVESFGAANLGYTGNAMTAGYWYPMLAPYRPGRSWLDVPWSPIGDPFASESADYTATITATPGVQIVAGGDAAREGNVWQFDLSRGRTFAFIASPNYWQTEVSVGGVTYSLYTFAEDTHLSLVAMQTIVQSAWLYSSLYGPYPYTTLRVAEVSGPWSMEFSGLVTLGAEEFADYNGTNRNRLARIAAHEVSHQWWYGVVGNDQAREPWLDEGIARFNELRYYEFYSPRDVGWWRSAVFSQAAADRMLDASIYDFHYHNSYISSIYNRGAVFLDALRSQIGQPVFNRFMRDLYRGGAFRIITSSDFFAMLAKHTQVDASAALGSFFASTPFDTARVSSNGGPSAPAPTQVQPAGPGRASE